MYCSSSCEWEIQRRISPRIFPVKNHFQWFWVSSSWITESLFPEPPFAPTFIFNTHKSRRLDQNAMRVSVSIWLSLCHPHVEHGWVQPGTEQVFGLAQWTLLLLLSPLRCPPTPWTNSWMQLNRAGWVTCTVCQLAVRLTHVQQSMYIMPVWSGVCVEYFFLPFLTLILKILKVQFSQIKQIFLPLHLRLVGSIQADSFGLIWSGFRYLSLKCLLPANTTELRGILLLVLQQASQATVLELLCTGEIFPLKTSLCSVHYSETVFSTNTRNCITTIIVP